MTGLLLAACKPAAEAPVAEEEPAEEEVVEEAPFEPKSFSQAECGDGDYIKAVEAVDAMTVKFTLCSPDPAFLVKIAFTPFFIQPEEWIESTGGTGELLEKPVGTGPWVLEQWERGDSLTFKRFDDYWGTPAKEETLVYRWRLDRIVLQRHEDSAVSSAHTVNTGNNSCFGDTDHLNTVAHADGKNKKRNQNAHGIYPESERSQYPQLPDNCH